MEATASTPSRTSSAIAEEEAEIEAGVSKEGRVKVQGALAAQRRSSSPKLQEEERFCCCFQGVLFLA